MKPAGCTPQVERMENIIRLGEWLTNAEQRLAAGSGEYTLAEAAQALRLAAAKTLAHPKTYILAHPEMALTAVDAAHLEQSVARLMRGEALPYVLGEWEFYGRPFTVTPDVLIPRPETELMVEQALGWVKERAGQPVYAADVGTGSGCIAVTLAAEVPGLQVTAVDVSRAALRVARINTTYHNVQERVHLVQGDLLSASAPRSFDLICVNLPYIPGGRLADLAVARREPLLALDGGPDGLTLIERLVADLNRLMRPGGLVLLEIDDTHEQSALALSRQYFPGQAAVLRDYQRKPRLLRVFSSEEGGK